MMFINLCLATQQTHTLAPINTAIITQQTRGDSTHQTHTLAASKHDMLAHSEHIR